ncbi:MAG: NADH-quinone oxidoreductase subunit N [Verrucomicrobia bacterium]|nr:NADH-quinone oxidoreductase subunit N [Verrucomicrobiota bacterium]
MDDLILIGPELAVLITGLAVLLLDLWAPPSQRKTIGYAAAAVLGVVFLGTFAFLLPEPRMAFGGMLVLDELALFFKRFFLLAAGLVLILAVEFSDRLKAGESEYFALILFALAGMMFAASANDFSILFVALELVTIAFYVLASFQRHRTRSLEAGVKYLILGALASGFLVYGIALVFGLSGTMNFTRLAQAPEAVLSSPLFELGLLLVFVGLGFKIAAVPFHIWAADVYEGAPAPTTAFLAVGSKAAGMVLLLRVLHGAVPALVDRAQPVLMVVAALTILYGVLCAIPQQNLKRLLGYSSIASAGYLLVGVAALNAAGLSAVLYYLAGYLFTVLAAFLVIALAFPNVDSEEIGALAGLHERAPLLAAALALALVSLAGVPPLAGFFGKFLLLKAALAAAGGTPGLYWLLGVAIVGVVISLAYYFGVIRTMYWEPHPPTSPSSPSSPSPPCLAVPTPMRVALWLCIAGMLWLGVMPGSILNLTDLAVQSLAPAVPVP